MNQNCLISCNFIVVSKYLLYSLTGFYVENNISIYFIDATKYRVASDLFSFKDQEKQTRFWKFPLMLKVQANKCYFCIIYTNFNEIFLKKNFFFDVRNLYRQSKYLKKLVQELLILPVNQIQILGLVRIKLHAQLKRCDVNTSRFQFTWRVAFVNEISRLKVTLNKNQSVHLLDIRGSTSYFIL